MMICSKCHAQFRKQERHDKHFAKCSGKVCRNCGKIGHLACGFSISSEQLTVDIQRRVADGERVRIIGLV
jgi:hypothetical protein